MNTNIIVAEPISREVGDRVVIAGGRDYVVPTARIVPATHKNAGDNEKAVYISQGKDMGGVSLSLETLEEILNWAKGNRK